MNHKLLFALSLCRKAGALITGFEPVRESVLQGQAYCVLCASDASPRTQRHTKELCEGLCDYYEMALSKETLNQITKKPTAVFAVTNPELANLCRQAMLQQTITQKEERI